MAAPIGGGNNRLYRGDGTLSVRSMLGLSALCTLGIEVSTSDTYIVRLHGRTRCNLYDLTHSAIIPIASDVRPPPYEPAGLPGLVKPSPHLKETGAQKAALP